jgi:hypothetical protein
MVRGNWVSRTRWNTRVETQTRYRAVTRYRAGEIQKPEMIIDTPLGGTMTLTLAAPAGTSMVLSDPVTGRNSHHRSLPNSSKGSVASAA